MFAHQVIDGLSKLVLFKNDAELGHAVPFQLAAELIKSIQQSQHFHLGERTDIFDIFDKHKQHIDGT
jgi:hypothetical protein